MRAVQITRFGGLDVLEDVTLPMPMPGPRDIVVRVEAVSVARLDLMTRAGHLPFVELPRVLGGEHAGVVSAVGAEVDDLEPGARVAAFPIVACGSCRCCRDGRADTCERRSLLGVHRQGAYAQWALVPRENVREVPATMSSAEAAAVVVGGAVACRQFSEAGLRASDWLLVQAAGGGLGSATAALGLHRGARVIATSRSPSKRAALEALGVDAALDGSAPDFVDAVWELTGGRGVDVAVDNLGDGHLFGRTLEVLAPTGTIVLSGGGQVNAGTAALATIDLGALYRQSQRIVGLSTADVAGFHTLWDDVLDGFRAPVDVTLPLTGANAREAHRRVSANENFGRVVLVCE